MSKRRQRDTKTEELKQIRHAQSPCGIRHRSPVPTESLLRSPRSSAGPLRDAATPHRRTDVDSRGSGGFWRLAPHLLSGPSVFPTIGTGGPFAGSPGAQRWAQADRRSSGLRGQLAGVRTPAHHRAVRPSHSRTFCHDHPPAQPGAGSGAAQKKTAWPDLKSSLPADAAADAYLYIRQSTPRQVLENIESTQRQYALRERAVALGWPGERIQVIDCDLGKTGSQAADGFQQLVSEVALGKDGMIMGLEVSRLARNCAD